MQNRYFSISLLLMFNGCTVVPSDPAMSVESPGLELTAFRFREDINAELNADNGWAASENAAPVLYYDDPFRLRIQVQAGSTPPQGHILSLQYRWQGRPWLPVGVSDFPYPSFATPVVSVISTRAYSHGAETEGLLGNVGADWEEGAGLNAVGVTPVWRLENNAMEWEWPLVIRRFSDGPTFAEDGIFELRVVDGNGLPIPAPVPIEMKVSAPQGHLGGTFIETPGRLGPYQSEEGHLYFFMEPSETDNRFMAVKSTDYGNSWREVDGAGRPMADDLEGVASVRTGSTIHLIHQVSREVFYHAFDMGDPGSRPDTWLVNSQSIATPEEPPTQFADVTARSDGSLVTLYSGSRRVFMQIRSPEGIWGVPMEIDSNVEPDLSGPVMVTGTDDIVTMAYTGRDGSGFIRHLYPDGRLSPRLLLSTNLGSDDKENGAILPLVALPETNTTVVLYREQDGIIYERRYSSEGELSAPVKVSNLPVITNAVDSDQVGADLIGYGSSLHLLFIEAHSRSIFYSQSDQPGIWSEPQPVVEGIEGAWLRGSIHVDAAGEPVYGFVFDGGSRGGSGFNRYFAHPLHILKR